ncbi:GNAT family N-acetyltransferase [Nocardioides caeni]|uniref:GNAT family N-acetyltransferase n=1 Tax=Nocardioides caeni TaxID=574700 RepID=A0A4S8N1J2_9ACTN|nr:GNAT family N-acetyltransferase [Nocardioides caeni]THV08919.1 GNAT family N-acetyltransferase [Nocardioides caeni]
MTALVEPDVRRWESWAAMIQDFGDVAQMHGSGHWHLEGPPVPTRAGCEAFVLMTELTAPADPDGTRVPSTYFWITAGDGGWDDEVVGFVHLRHHLNDHLLVHGGHLGYAVRPSARRRGHATAALALGLQAAARLGVEQALLTCEAGNEPSRRTIERNGGVFEDETAEGLLRFWVPTAS